MIDIISIVCINITVLYIWFKTSAFVDYCILFNFNKPINGFLKQNILSYPQYLFINKEKISKNNKYFTFIIKLITCPVCLLFWTTLWFCLFYEVLNMFFIVYIISLLSYSLITKFSL
jgi:hypothetical protein